MERMLESGFGPASNHPGLGHLIPTGFNPYTGHFSSLSGIPNGFAAAAAAASSFSPEYNLGPHTSMTSPQPGVAGGAIGTMAFTIDGLLTSSQSQTPNSQSGSSNGQNKGSGECQVICF